MSAFLGPVHHWMYGKITLQEELTARLLTLSVDPALAGRLDAAYGAADTRPLETIIDQSNIHGWLNGCVQRAEKRFAGTVEALLAQENGEIERLTAIAKVFGQERTLAQGVDVAQAYQAIDSVLLDGMPCDGGRQVVNEDADELIFQYNAALHVLCRSDAGMAAFTALREALLDGMVENTGLQLDALGGGTYRLRKGA